MCDLQNDQVAANRVVRAVSRSGVPNRRSLLLLFPSDNPAYFHFSFPDGLPLRPRQGKFFLLLRKRASDGASAEARAFDQFFHTSPSFLLTCSFSLRFYSLFQSNCAF